MSHEGLLSSGRSGKTEEIAFKLDLMEEQGLSPQDAVKKALAVE